MLIRSCLNGFLVTLSHSISVNESLHIYVLLKYSISAVFPCQGLKAAIWENFHVTPSHALANPEVQNATPLVFCSQEGLMYSIHAKCAQICQILIEKCCL